MYVGSWIKGKLLRKIFPTYSVGMSCFFLPFPSLSQGLFCINIHSVLLCFLSVNLVQKSLSAKGNLRIYATQIWRFRKATFLKLNSLSYIYIYVCICYIFFFFWFVILNCPLVFFDEKQTFFLHCKMKVLVIGKYLSKHNSTFWKQS